MDRYKACKLRLGCHHPNTRMTSSSSNSGDSNKRRLHDYTRQQHWPQPVYTNNPLNRSWKSIVQIDGTTYGEGHGNSIKEAEADAAKQALIHFNLPAL
ncbi:hypothetical protein AX14_001940 [Amanita brunnescens Koide BX004]|nr:hypothetical protein AX14_001940 [Amanita brunnescens Koide BX004]